MDPKLHAEILGYKINGEYPPGLSKMEKFLLRRKAAQYDTDGGQLYYWRYKGTAKQFRTKVVCGAEEAKNIFIEFHASATGAHCGQVKTRDAIAKRYHWLGMSSDIDKWVSQCVACQASMKSIKQEVLYTPIKVTQPFELVGMDLIGKLSKTKRGHQYICVMIDYLTKWPQAYPLRSKAADEVTRCIIQFFHQFEAPKRILTDQGKEFVNEINQKVCEILNITRSLCSPYHPQTNGLVERMNGTIQRALSKMVGKRPETWDDFLDAVMFGLRTKKQMTTKFSPYYLMFGREARYPSEVPEHYPIDSGVEDIVGQENKSEEIQRLETILKVVEKNVEESQDKARKRLKSSSAKTNFKVGDRVWRQNVRSQQRKGGKLDANFLGPFTIIALEGKSADLEGENGSTIKKINVDHLQHYREEAPRIPHQMERHPKKHKPPMIPTPVTVAPKVPCTGAPVPAVPDTPTLAATTSVIVAPKVPLKTALVPAVSDIPTLAATSVIVAPKVSLKTSLVPAVSKVPTLAATKSVIVAPKVPLKTAPVPAISDIPTLAATSVIVTPKVSLKTAPVPAVSKVPTLAATKSVIVAPKVPLTAAPVPLLSPASLSTASASAPALPAPVCGQSQAEKYVLEAWAGKKEHILLAKIGAYKLFYWDIGQIGPDMELESETINAYLAVLVREYNGSQDMNQAFFIDSFAMTAIWKGKSPRLRFDPMAYKVILGIVNDHHHWTLTVMYPTEKRALFFDPLGESEGDLKQCLESTRAFMRKKGVNVSRWTCSTLSHPRQPDGTSCGVFSLKIAEHILREKPIHFNTTPEAIRSHRLQIASTLLQKSDDLSNLCHYCGEEEHDEDPNWIQCNSCLRWFHHKCVNSPLTDRDYFCYACENN